MGRTEYRVLLDHAYSEFEERLIEDGKMSVVSGRGKDEYDPSRPFVKVTGKAILTDIGAVAKVVKSFNEMGESLSYVSSFKDIESAKEALDVQLSAVKDRNEKARVKRSIQKMTDPIRIARDSGLNMDPKYLEHLAYILEFGYNDLFEIQIDKSEGSAEKSFTSHLQREWLRENEELLIKKYSRRTDKNFTVVGIVAQDFGTGYSQDHEEVAEVQVGLAESGPDPDGMRHALRNLALSLSGIEQTFSGKYSGEMILDPIAVYREL